jgi:DNA-binding NtrC family response regulator
MNVEWLVDKSPINIKTNQPTILIIDDEEELCLLLSYALARLGYQIEYALTLEDGNKKIKQYKPKLVVLDINLPDGSGLDIIPQIKKLNSSFLVISAFSDKKEAAMKQGAADFIEKPFNLSKITKSIVGINVN